jgi:uracil permease
VSFGAVEIRTVACALILGILSNVMLSKEKDEEE